MEISSEEEEKKMETSLSSNEIREMCKMWETDQKFIEKHHPSNAVAVRAINLFNDDARSYFCEILKRRQKQVSLIGFLLKSHKKKKSQHIAVIPLVTMKVVLPNN
jgi:hypothetical protein